jgi:TonB-linked SusC/RagA family outer membrane protein
MKKTYSFLWDLKIPIKTKLLRVMKLTIFLLLISVVSVFASKTYSQTKNLNLNLYQVSVKEVLTNIEEQSEFYFMYSEKVIDVNREVSVDINNQKIETALSLLFEDTDVEYSIKDRIIVLTTPEVFNTNDNAVFQQKSVSGIVVDDKGELLPGVTVMVKGTSQGTVSDVNGKYFISEIPVNATLVFSFVGMRKQEIVVGNQSNINVTLQFDAIGLSEVVVTALGIEREKKTLTYATQEIDMDGLSTVKDYSLGNSLAGKIAGVSITSSTGATGVSGDPRIILRGDRSIQNNNQPLIVVDGIPYASAGGGLSSINPDDVESMNILKGPAAAALYGSSANNGVIVVTTKSGKIGEPQITVNSVTNFEFPYLFPRLQNEYGQGADGTYSAFNPASSWGPKMSGQSVQNFHGETVSLDPQPDNARDFFQVGHNLTNSFSYSTGTEKSTTYFSYSNTLAQGILTDNKMIRHNFNLRLTTELIKNLNMDFKLTYFRQELDDQPQTSFGQFSPMSHLTKMPRSMRTADIENASYIDENFELKQNTWAPNSTFVLNPYWSRDGFESPSTNNKVNSFIRLRYDFNNYLYLQVRGGMVISNNDAEEKTYWDTEYINAGVGDYYTTFSKGQSLNSDVLLSFNKEVAKDLQLGLSVGAEIKDVQSRSQWSQAGGLTTENKFSLDYAVNLSSEDSESRIQKQSVYGMGQLSYKNFLFLDATARNDWSSTLPAPHSYFYPSVGLTGIVSEMFDLPEVISFAKLRGSYAEVGNDATFSSILQTFSSSAYGSIGMFKPSSTKVAAELIPENTKSWELGADLKFFDNRLGVDFTWYKSNTFNQLVKVTTPPTSGYSSGWINAGNIQNKGIEVMLYATPVKTMNFSWNVDLNFAKNNNKVIELTETLDEYEISTPNLAVSHAWIITGKPYGELYTIGFERNDAGKVIVDELGRPKVMDGYDLYLGNFNYDWRSGITNSFSYKNWNMSFLIDLNYGGVRGSSSEAMMDYCGTSVNSLQGREEGIIVDGVKEDGSVNDIVVTAQEYFMTVGGRITSGSGELYSHEATNSRLREFTLGYTFPLRSSVVKSLRVSAVGRNLFYIYNACDWFDPDGTYDTGDNGQGAENAFLPGTRTLGVNIKVTL